MKNQSNEGIHREEMPTANTYNPIYEGKIPKIYTTFSTLHAASLANGSPATRYELR